MKQRIAVAAILLIAVVALAGPIKVWSAGEVVTANDLNANFQHVHNVMVGGHGARLVNTDVSASAGIAHSKLATPALLPKAVGGVLNRCTSTPCSWSVNSGFSSTFTRFGIGQFDLTFATARPNATYLVTAAYVSSGSDPSVGGSAPRCSASTTLTTSGFSVLCRVLPPDGGVDQAVDLPFTVTVFDDNN